METNAIYFSVNANTQQIVLQYISMLELIDISWIKVIMIGIHVSEYFT